MKKNMKAIAFGLAILAILAFSPFALKTAEAQGVNAYTPPTNPGALPANPSYNYGTSGSPSYYGYPLYSGPAPTVSSVTPNAIGVKQAVDGMSIAINGGNFIPGSIARWDNRDVATIYVNSSYLVMQISAADVSFPGTHQVSVFNGTAGGLSNSVVFQVTGGSTSASASTVKKSTTSSTASGGTTSTSQTTNNTDPNASNLAANVLNGTQKGFWPSGLIQWLFVAILILLGVIIFRKIYSMDKEEVPLKHA